MEKNISEYLVISDGKLLYSNPTVIKRAANTYYPTISAFGIFENRTAEAAWVYDVNGTTYAYPRPSPINNTTMPLPMPNSTWPKGAY
jgi:hypothetical protein